MKKIISVLMLVGMMGFTGPKRPPPLIDVVEFSSAFDNYRWCLSDGGYRTLIKRDQELNWIIDYYEARAQEK